jgi:predicted RNA methylase
MENQKKGTKEYWSMTEGVFNCLIDKKRTLAFKKAIFNTVRKGDVVVDMGTGSGILAMFAADAGASKVYAIENDENNIKTLEENFKSNGFQDRIILIKGDVRKIRLPEKADVIIGEMIATGLIEEQQISAMNNMLKNAKKGVKVLIKSYESFVDLVYNKESFYGYDLKNFRYEYTGVGEIKSKIFSSTIMYSKVNFMKKNQNHKINKSFAIKINHSGIINALRISSKTIFFDNSFLTYSFAYSYPIILPINSAKVKKNDEFRVDLSYIINGGFQNLRYSVVKNLKTNK